MALSDFRRKKLIYVYKTFFGECTICRLRTIVKLRIFFSNYILQMWTTAVVSIKKISACPPR